MTGECIALHMTNTKKIITGYSDLQIKEAIINVGGEVNFQVKYNGAPGRAIPDMILDQWKSSKLDKNLNPQSKNSRVHDNVIHCSGSCHIFK